MMLIDADGGDLYQNRWRYRCCGGYAGAVSREFWAEAKKRSKMKSPLELAVSSLRALEADIRNPQPMMYLV